MAPSRGIFTAPFSSPRHVCRHCLSRRAFTTAPALHSGHNRWSKIKHDKGKNDAARNRQRSAFAQEIATASKLFGPEPSLNPRLAESVTKAKREGLPKAIIEAAIARGQGRSLTGASLESVTVEGILPGNVAVIVECETDSRLRTLANVRLALKEAGGREGPSAYLFEKRGRVVLEQKEGIGVEEVLEAALEAGATDVVEDETEEGSIVLFSEPGDTKSVGEAVNSALGLAIKTSGIVWSANEDTKVDVSTEEAAAELEGFVDELAEKEPSVQAVAMNVRPSADLSGDSWTELVGRLKI